MTQRKKTRHTEHKILPSSSNDHETKKNPQHREKEQWPSSKQIKKRRGKLKQKKKNMRKGNKKEAYKKHPR